MNRTMPERILLTRLRFIGDVVLTTPIIRAVHAAYPDAYLAYLGDRKAVSLLEQNPFLDEIIPYDFARRSVLEQWRVGRLLRRRRFDLVIDMFNNPRSAQLVFASRARVRVGLDRRGRGRMYTVRVRDDGNAKTPVAFHNQFLAAIGIAPADHETELFLSKDEHVEARQYIPGGEGALVCIHPGATWPAKRWLPERFGALSDALVERGFRVLVVGGAGDSDAIRAMVESCSEVPHVAPPLPLRTLAAIIAECDAFVGNDAGPMHIAPAVGVPTVGLFGPGEEEIWFPYSTAKGHCALRMNVPCHPCHKDVCPRDGDGYMECMNILGVEDVLNAVVAAARRGG